MNNLTVYLFGRPQFFVDGVEATGFNTRKDCALLAYLAATGTAHSREHLAGLLWSDLPETTARRNLRHTLSHLQKVIGPGWIETEHGVGLTRRLPWSVDVQQMSAAVRALGASSSATPPPLSDAALDALDQALAAYRGEFLHGFYVQNAAYFEAWVLARREEYHLLALRGLEVMAQWALERGDAIKGLAATRRLLQLEPWSETAHCLQMELLVANGQRAAALVQYESCRQLLAAELGVEPMPATTALYQQIQTGTYSGLLIQRRPEPTAPPAFTAQAVALPANAMPAVASPPNNLLAPLAGFVGRQAELALISQRLATADCRLLTLVGPGGMGKTSLALALGQRLLHAQQAEFPDGIFFVSLVDIGAIGRDRSEPALAEDPVSGEAILRAIAEQIGYKLEAGVSPAVQLQSYLRPRRLLLILDNFEHLLAGTAAVVTLLTQAPQIKALITSRARLNVRGESVLTLGPLSLTAATHAAAVAQANPADAIPEEAWQTSEVVAMFVQRAQQHDPSFVINAATLAPVVQICQLVEGLPLGIELAASMLPQLSCDALVKELAESLDFLAADTRDLPHDQRTLRAVFERSWRLLAPEGQLMLARLAIFPSSFQRTAAERIAGASTATLRSLLDQSLLSKVGAERYVMHRTIHSFAQQKLQQWTEQSTTLHEQYAHFYLEFLARLEQEQSEEVLATVIGQIQTDLDNVRTAWRWSSDQGNLALLELGVESLHEFYRLAGIYPEAIQLLEAALPAVRRAVVFAPASVQSQRLLARLLCYTAQFYRLYRQAGLVEKGETLANEALELGRRLADPALQALAYHQLARLAERRVDFAAMRRLAEQACIYGRQANLPHLIAENLNDLGIAVGVYTHPLAATQHFHEALAYLHQRPNHLLEARIISNLGLFHLVGHVYQTAYRYFQQRRTMQRLLLNEANSLMSQINYGDLWMALGDYPQAQAEYVQAQAMVQARHAPYWESWLHVGYGRLQRLCGELITAHSTCQLALQIAQKDGGRTEIQWALIELGHVLAELGNYAAAALCYQEAIDLPTGMNYFFRTPDAHAGLAALALAQNEVAAAVTHAEAALALLDQQGVAAAGEPFAVYWTCVCVLQAAGDPRAQTVLASGYQALQEIAHQLEDERLRRSFLENVVVNRQLVAAAQAAGIIHPMLLLSR